MGNSISDEIDVTPAGPWCDLAVAAAFGCIVRDYTMPDGREVQALFSDGRMDIAPWSPSRNWTDAMCSAERFELFDYSNSGWGLSLNRTTEWRVYDSDAVAQWRSHEAVIATAPTGPLAICRAILKLHAGSSGYIESLEKELRDEIKRRDAEHWDYVRGSGTDSPATRREDAE